MSDLRTALRALMTARGLTATAVMTLGAGMMLCITVMTVMNAYLIRTLPYPAADRLYRVEYAAPGQTPPRGLETLDWPSLGEAIEFALSWDLDVFYMLGGDYPERAPGAWVTPGYMSGFGVRTAIGRTFDADDFRPGSPAVAIISHRIWHVRFGGAANVIGQTFHAYVSDRPEEPEAFTIIGVLPADHWHVNGYSEVLAPLKAASYPYMVRLRPGVSAQVARDRIASLVQGSMPALPRDWQPILTSVQDSYVASIRPMLWSVGAAAALVVLIAGANVAVLLLIRGRRRQRELAVRLALGASHARVARLLVFEGVLLGVAATAVGLAGSQWAMAWLAPVIEQFLERRAPGGVDAFTLDTTVLVATIACGFAVTLVFAVAPVIPIWRSTLGPNLSNAGRTTTDGKASGRTRSALIGIEVAASLTLLVGASMMAESAIRMLRVDFGIEAEGVLGASLTLRQQSYPDSTARADFYDRLLTQVSSLRGVTAVALGDWWPMQTRRPTPVATRDPEPIAGDASIFAVSPSYFSVLGLTLADGRAFTERDRGGSELVVIVSAGLAQRMWPGARAVGQSLTILAGDDTPETRHEVVGVVNDVRQMHGDTHLFDAYLPVAQRADRFAFLYLRGDGASLGDAALRSAVAAIDQEVAVGAPRPLAAGLDQERVKPRFLAMLLTLFALVASLLALVGMHGVIAYAVRQRQREIAVRLAIGAAARDVTRLFVAQGAVVLAGGVIAGLAGAIGLGRVLQSQLHGVQPTEPRILMVSALLFAISGLAAVWWPAWRAASTDPVLALRED